VLNEIWKDVVGYEGLYYVSSFGRVRNKHGRIMSPAANWAGYLGICFMTQEQVGEYFNVARTTIQDIANGKTWSHIWSE